jgi:hypothetical protein
MLRWIFWILILFWLFSKIKYLFVEDEEQGEKSNTPRLDMSDTSSAPKKLKNDAGDYIDYEEIN